MKKEYKKGEMTVVWQPDLCIHSAICFHQLPEVFKPRERPWIQLEGADNNRIESTVRACPSGAISFKEVTPIQTMSTELPQIEPTKVTIIPNGPAKVWGPCNVVLQDGTVVEKPNGVTICRCGLSANLPLCDGSHKTNGFVG